jgi:hypothetical protein
MREIMVLATVVPDERFPSMWRIKWPDGRVSDMVNLARARDAAKVIAARKLSTATSVFGSSRLKWQTNDPRLEGVRDSRGRGVHALFREGRELAP